MKPLQLVLVTIGVLLLCVALTSAYTISGNTVYIDDAKAYISATPHTLTGDQWVTFTMTPKTFTGNLNAIWGFNTTQARPTQALFLDPHNVTTSLSCNSPYWYNYTLSPKKAWCWENTTDGNGTVHVNPIWEHTFYRADIPADTIYYNTTENWRDVTDRFQALDVNFLGNNKWYYVTNIPVTAGKTYTLKAWVDVPFCKKGDSLCPSAGKYDMAVYPSIYGSNLAAANTAGNLYRLDPWWWNTTWGNSIALTYQGNGTVLSNHQVCGFLNVSALAPYMDSCSEFRVLDNTNTTQYKFWWPNNRCNTTSEFTYFCFNATSVAAGANKVYLYFNNSASSYANNSGIQVFQYYYERDHNASMTGGNNMVHTVGSYMWIRGGSSSPNIYFNASSSRNQVLDVSYQLGNTVVAPSESGGSFLLTDGESVSQLHKLCQAGSFWKDYYNAYVTDDNVMHIGYDYVTSNTDYRLLIDVNITNGRKMRYQFFNLTGGHNQVYNTGWINGLASPTTSTKVAYAGWTYSDIYVLYMAVRKSPALSFTSTYSVNTQALPTPAWVSNFNRTNSTSHFPVISLLTPTIATNCSLYINGTQYANTTKNPNRHYKKHFNLG